MPSTRTTTYAIEMSAYGAPDVLKYREIALSPLAANDVRIKTLAAAVNHTDLEIRAGNWPVRRPLPYVPGVESVGVIDEVGTSVLGWAPGQTVITMMQGLGGVRADRPGGYSQFVTVDAGSIAAVPADVDPMQMASIGLVGVTAYHGLQKLEPLAGKRVLITGAAGGVGSAATAIAHAQGASVVGLVSRSEDVDYVRELGASEVIVVSRTGQKGVTLPSVDGVLDSVAGALFGSCVTSLRPGGVLSLVGAVAGANVVFDAWQLIRPVRLTGYSTEDLTGDSLRQAIAALSGWLAGKQVRAPQHLVMPLADAGRAHQLIEQRATKGRILLIPD